MKPPVYRNPSVRKIDNLNGDISAIRSSIISFNNDGSKTPMIDWETGKITEKGESHIESMLRQKHKSVFFQYRFTLKADHYINYVFKKDLPKEILTGIDFDTRNPEEQNDCIKISTFSALCVYQYYTYTIYDKHIHNFLQSLKTALETHCPITFKVWQKMEHYHPTAEERDNFQYLKTIDLTLSIEMPFYVKNQLIKHSVGFASNEISRRYTPKDISFCIPVNEAGEVVFREQNKDKKQCSIEGTEIKEKGNAKDLIEKNYNYYLENIENEACKEQSRAILPQFTNTTQIITANLDGWIRMLSLRLAEDTQKETRDVAKLIYEIVKLEMLKDARTRSMNLDELIALRGKFFY